MNDIERLLECVNCEYFDKCYGSVLNPEEYADGRCKTKDILSGGN